MAKLSVAVLLTIVLLWFDSQAACTTCHSDHAEKLKHTPHAVLQTDGNSSVCVACHGEAAGHTTNPTVHDMTTFNTESVIEKNAVCSGCHNQPHNAGNDGHSRFDVACTDCHKIHTESEPVSSLMTDDNLEFGTAVCAGCHEDTLAQFAFNKRHRLRENSVSCTSCHDPHADLQPAVLGAAALEGCSDCHADKDGPFVFEHAASRVEGCVACHAPHGSPNRHMLTHQSVGEQCYSCHAEVAQFHLGFSPAGPPRFGVDTVCTNCHSTIHGSNLDPDFLK